jgi:hypothetical protein
VRDLNVNLLANSPARAFHGWGIFTNRPGSVERYLAEAVSPGSDQSSLIGQLIQFTPIMQHNLPLRLSDEADDALVPKFGQGA